MNRSYGYGIIALVLISVVSMVLAKDILISSAEKLLRYLNKTELAVVMFYSVDKETAKNKQLKKQINVLEKMFSSTSATRPFKEAEVQFLRVNVARKETLDLHEEYGITKLPAFVLFQDSTPVKEQKNGQSQEVLQLNGFVTKKALKDFIEHYFTDDMSRIVDEKAEERQRKLEEQQLNVGPYWYYSAYPYWYYPYGYWGWRGPYWGGFWGW